MEGFQCVAMSESVSDTCVDLIFVSIAKNSDEIMKNEEVKSKGV